MKKQTKTSMKYFRSFGIALLVIGISIGAYGIFRAPSSDASRLENELMQNERELEKEEATPAYAAAKTPAATKKQTAAPRVPDIHESSITVIGDSVFLGAAPSFKKLYKNAVIDAKVSRQVVQALDTAKKLQKKGRLGDTVIIALGTNGNFNSATGQKLIDYLGRVRSTGSMLTDATSRFKRMSIRLSEESPQPIKTSM